MEVLAARIAIDAGITAKSVQIGATGSESHAIVCILPPKKQAVQAAVLLAESAMLAAEIDTGEIDRWLVGT